MLKTVRLQLYGFQIRLPIVFRYFPFIDWFFWKQWDKHTPTGRPYFVSSSTPRKSKQHKISDRDKCDYGFKRSHSCFHFWSCHTLDSFIGSLRTAKWDLCRCRFTIRQLPQIIRDKWRMYIIRLTPNHSIEQDQDPQGVFLKKVEKIG